MVVTDRRRFGLLVACLAAQVTFVVSAVPPWQNPDEPQHLTGVRLIVAHGADFALGARDEAGERAIVESMAQHGWWHHYGRRTPAPVPTTFDEGPAVVVRDAFTAPQSGSRLYYRIVASLFGWAGIESVVSQMYAMRLISAAAALLTLWCVWCASRVWLDARSAFVVTALLTLHPQFVIVSTTASPDSVSNLAAAVVWWNAVVLLARPPRFRALTLMWAAAIVGFMIRRMTAPLLLGAMLVTLVVFGRALLSTVPAPAVRRFTYVFLALLVVAGVAWSWVPDDLDVRTLEGQSTATVEVLSAIQAIRFSPARAVEGVVQQRDRLPAFFTGLHESFWLAVGWLRYKAHPAWYLVMAGVGLLALVGLGRPTTREGSRSVLLAAVAVVLLQTAAVVVYYLGIQGSGPQGRYLFPALPAAMSLIWVGWQGLFPVAHRSWAALSLLSLMAVMTAIGWTAVLLPAYG